MWQLVCRIQPKHFGRRNCEMVYGNRLWLPSQKAPFLECLQPHHATVFSSVMSTFIGAKLEPLCEPSQNGWPWDLPQVHQ